MNNRPGFVLLELVIGLTVMLYTLTALAGAYRLAKTLLNQGQIRLQARNELSSRLEKFKSGERAVGIVLTPLSPTLQQAVVMSGERCLVTIVPNAVVLP